MSENKKCEDCEARKYAEGILEYYLSLEKSLDYSGGVLKNFYHVFVKLLWWPSEQPKRVDSAEEGYIVSLRKTGFSIGDIAFIVGRSKSTVHDVLAKTAKLEKSIR